MYYSEVSLGSTKKCSMDVQQASEGTYCHYRKRICVIQVQLIFSEGSLGKVGNPLMSNQ